MILRRHEFVTSEEIGECELFAVFSLLNSARGTNKPYTEDPRFIIEDLNNYRMYNGGAKFGETNVYTCESGIVALSHVVKTSFSAELTAIAVNPNLRNRSIGNLVMTDITYRVDELHLPTFLYVLKNNLIARRMFGNFGFKNLPDNDERQNSVKYLAMLRPEIS